MDWSGIFNEIFSVIYNILYFGVIIGMIIIVILDNRNPVKTMAWILVLSFLPLVGLVFYFFFGRSTRRERIISKKSYNRLMKKPMAEFVASTSTKEKVKD
jgi:cardiolipin synthase